MALIAYNRDSIIEYMSKNSVSDILNTKGKNSITKKILQKWIKTFGNLTNDIDTKELFKNKIKMAGMLHDHCLRASSVVPTTPITGSNNAVILSTPLTNEQTAPETPTAPSKPQPELQPRKILFEEDQVENTNDKNTNDKNTNKNNNPVGSPCTAYVWRGGMLRLCGISRNVSTYTQINFDGTNTGKTRTIHVCGGKCSTKLRNTLAHQNTTLAFTPGSTDTLDGPFPRGKNTLVDWEVASVDDTTEDGEIVEKLPRPYLKPRVNNYIHFGFQGEPINLTAPLSADADDSSIGCFQKIKNNKIDFPISDEEIKVLNESRSLPTHPAGKKTNGRGNKSTRPKNQKAAKANNDNTTTRKKKNKKNIHPSGLIPPKRPTNAYFLYAQEKREQIISENPESNIGAISKILGGMWKELPSDQKKPYEESYAAAKLKWIEETQEYQAAIDKYNFEHGATETQTENLPVPGPDNATDNATDNNATEAFNPDEFAAQFSHDDNDNDNDDDQDDDDQDDDEEAQLIHLADGTQAYLTQSDNMLYNVDGEEIGTYDPETNTKC